MKCQVCDGNSSDFLKKSFSYPFFFEVQYRKCDMCGLVFSATHRDMSKSELNRLNIEYHLKYAGTVNPNDPKWLPRIKAQANSINIAAKAGLIDTDLDWLDFGCGTGKLSVLVRYLTGKVMNQFDRYEQRASLDYTEISAVPTSFFGMTVSTAVFEHLNLRQELDEIHETVSESGVLALHTLVCEEIPQDPNWFYYLPVHSTFFTNKSMSILHSQWGYTCSAYDVDARLWFWCKQPNKQVLNKVKQIQLLRPETFLFTTGFLDYWK